MIYIKEFDGREASREEWLQFRRSGIGGSDMSAILGLNPWRSVLDVWLDKTSDEEPEEEQSEYAYWGTVLEAVVADEFQRRTGMKVRRCNYTLRSIEHPFMLANIDRELVGIDEGLECKTASAYKEAEWKGDLVPDSYYVQCQHYMAVTGYKAWWIACLIGGNQFVYKRIERNDEFIAQLIEAGRQFWELVEKKQMPAVDGTRKCTETLRELHPESNGETIVLPDTAKIYIEQYKSAKEAEEDAVYRKTEAQNNLIKLLGDNEAGTVDTFTVSYKNSKPRETFDTKKFKKDHPQLAGAYTKHGAPSRRFAIKE